MSQAAIATKIGSELASKLQNITDEKVIKTSTIEAWKQLKEAITNPSTFSSRGLSNARKAIKEVFPDSETPKQGYYHTTQGKGQTPRYEHLALWYLTANTDRWEITGDKARQSYFENLPKLSSQTESQPETQPQPEAQPETQTSPQPTLKLENMTLQQLELDIETHQIVQDALNHSGMSLADFVKQACKVYARTVIGKAQQATKSELESIPTAELLNNSKLRTLPGRAEELAKRAMVAIMHHNDMATEKSQKWCITATAINKLTGSKIPLINNVMEQYKLMIDDHNAKHGLNPYDNRGRATKIEEDIDFVNFSETSTPVATAPVTTTVEPTKVEPVKPKTTKPLPKATQIKVVPLETSLLDIHEILKANPGSKVRVKDGRKALTYVLIPEGIKIEETGEIEKLA
ncbi:hypothetical protein F7734_43260 [Scytonema sp. UIC 10036]|uniref:hypothetical protein n=1 Tax=Scytonema sp. UIC 10036 TaxID=2304196 RepID=UPI0012DA9874|nr:hypothetical protein [Scytonema sp. UIC 10036]MUG98753.1 hypothetical protein [Scytonema sp. UIC 10036]